MREEGGRDDSKLEIARARISRAIFPPGASIAKYLAAFARKFSSPVIARHNPRNIRAIAVFLCHENFVLGFDIPFWVSNKPTCLNHCDPIVLAVRYLNRFFFVLSREEAHILLPQKKKTVSNFIIILGNLLFQLFYECLLLMKQG